jgi:NADH dehydrogenase
MNMIIVGGGFGGVKTALELAKDSANHITLITDKPDFQYYPALYSTATGHSHLESWVPLSKIFAGINNIDVQLDTINSIDPTTKTLQAASGKQYNYETCVLALGTVTTYFGIEGLDQFAYGIKSAAEITKLKQHIYTDLVKNRAMDKHYVVIGAGPTGVELAAALGSYLNRLCKQYDLKDQKMQIHLVEAAPRILPRMSEQVSARVEKRLRKLGVSVQLGQAVESETADQIMVGGKPIESHTVIWTSGVANHPFYKNNAAHFTFAPNGRVTVDEHMQAIKDVYVIGDNAATQYTGLAQTALHDALFVAANFKRQAQGKALLPYKAVKPPVVVPVGANWAVFEWHAVRLYGWVGALLRQAADVIGYNDVLPIGQALGVWRARMVKSDDHMIDASSQK